MWFLVLGLFALGCAAANEQDRRTFVFQVDPDSPLWGPAVQAAADWSAATGLDVRVSPTDGMPIFFVEALSGCHKDPENDGCSFKGGARGGWIEVRSDTPPNELRVLLTHEMGHEMRGDGVHLTQENTLMHSPTMDKQKITAADVEFICQVCECSTAAA